MKSFLATAMVLTVLVSGCAAPAPSSSVVLALDGPELAVAGTDGARSWQGGMERGVMAGVGRMHISDGSRACQGSMDHPASEKGRLYIRMTCSDGKEGYFVLRNLGPDQGMGTGRVEGEDGRISLFYHPSEAEAVRRLSQVHDDLERADAIRKSKEAPPEGGK